MCHKKLKNIYLKKFIFQLNINIVCFKAIDSDLAKLGSNEVLHKFNTETNTWN